MKIIRGKESRCHVPLMCNESKMPSFYHEWIAMAAGTAAARGRGRGVGHIPGGRRGKQGWGAGQNHHTSQQRRSCNSKKG
jgi:hypothetical protein